MVLDSVILIRNEQKCKKYTCITVHFKFVCMCVCVIDE